MQHSSKNATKYFVLGLRKAGKKLSFADRYLMPCKLMRIELSNRDRSNVECRLAADECRVP